MTVLVTGGAGYIGSHACLELLRAGRDVVVVDNLQNSSEASLRRVQELAGKPLVFYRADVRDRSAMENIFRKHALDSVLHFAGLKAVGESVEVPIEYYMNNVVGTLVLCDVMSAFGVKRLAFSSSATVYGMPERVPIREDAPLSATNPYGRTKLMIEDILRDIHRSDDGWSIALLRYFNPVGAHESGRIGEDPNGVPNNLMPYLTQVAASKLPKANVYGDDYDTRDGTGVRDYIHVVDLAKGHLKALDYVAGRRGVEAFNLGTGRGYSVLEMIAAVEKASGRSVPYTIVGRRPGDVGACYADPTKAREMLGWVAEKGVEAMCADAWRWQSAHPNGYADDARTAAPYTEAAV
jgi:UDP-glucose 4-epimerase